MLRTSANIITHVDADGSKWHLVEFWYVSGRWMRTLETNSLYLAGRWYDEICSTGWCNEGEPEPVKMEAA